MLLTVDPDGTERVLVDPMALDPTGLTTLDTWQPTKEGDLLAYQLSEGGTEESVLRVMDVATGAARRRPDRPGALLPRRLAARRRGVLLRPPPAPPTLLPDGRGAVPPPGLAAPARHRPGRRRPGLRRRAGQAPTTTASRSRRDGRWLSSSASDGHRAAQRPLARRPVRRSPLDAPDLRRRAGRRRRAAPALAGRPRRPGLRLHRPRRPARPARVTDARRPRPYEHWTDLRARGPRGGARRLRDPRRRRARRRRRAARVLDPARGRRGHACTTWRTGERDRRRSPLPGLGSVGGARRAARGRARGVVRLHRPRHAVVGPPLRRARPARPRCGRPRRAPSTCPRCTPGRWSTPRPTAPPCGCSCSPGRPRSPDRPRPDRPLRLRRLRHPADPRLLGRACSPGSRPAASTRSPTCAAAARRARSGTAPGCSGTSRTSSTTSTPPPSGSSPTAGRRPTSWRSPAAPTAGCSSAPR